MSIRTTADLETALENIDEKISTVTSENAALAAKLKDVTVLTKSKYFNQPDKEHAEIDKQFGEFAKALVAAKMGSATTKQRELIEPHRGSVNLEEKADLGTPLFSDSATGSYITPVAYFDEIIRVAEDMSELMPLVRKLPMTARTMYFPTTDASVAFVYTATDGADTTESNPTFGQTLLTSYTYALYVGVTEALLEDDIITLGEYLRTLAGEKWADKYDAELLTGSGSPTTGLMNDTSVNSSQMDTGSTTASDIDIDDCYALVEDLTTAAKRRGSVFIMNPLTYDKVRKLKDADGTPLIAPWQEMAAKQLFGYPVKFSDQMPSAPAADTAFVGFGNPKYMLHGERTSMEMKFYDQTSYAVTNTEAFFRFRIRAAFDIGVPAAFSILKTAAS